MAKLMNDNSNSKNKILKKKASDLDFSKAEYDRALEKWSSDFYSETEELLNSLFFEKTISKDFKKEYEKVCLLNQIYNTHLYGKEIIEIANYLTNKKNTDRLNFLIEQGDERAVADLTRALKKDENGRLCYSFATKYCSFSATYKKADCFPIYDNIVSIVYKNRRDIWDKGLSIPNEIFNTPKSSDSEEKVVERYKEYRRSVESMKQSMNFIDSVKHLDQYLWMVMNMN